MNAIERKARELCEAAGGNPNRFRVGVGAVRRVHDDGRIELVGDWYHWQDEARRILAAGARDES